MDTEKELIKWMRVKNSIFFIGDFKTNSGPGMANRMFRRGMDGMSGVTFSDAAGRLARIVEIMTKTVRSDSICLCSLSRSNRIAIMTAHLFRRRIYYLMHGYFSLETELNGCGEKDVENSRKFEQYLFKNATKIICVSQKCAEYMRECEPRWRHKFVSVNNPISLTDIVDASNRNREKASDIITILSLGGGVGIKNNKNVVAAVRLLEEEGYKIGLQIIGKPGIDKDEICRHHFVEYHESLGHEEVLKKMASADLYVQNSYFETFGLAPVEALYSGCSILLSRNMGVTGLFRDLDENDVIEDVDNIHEIRDKIQYLLRHPNQGRLIESFLYDQVDPSTTAKELVRIINYG